MGLVGGRSGAPFHLAPLSICRPRARPRLRHGEGLAGGSVAGGRIGAREAMGAPPDRLEGLRALG